MWKANRERCLFCLKSVSTCIAYFVVFKQTETDLPPSMYPSIPSRDLRSLIAKKMPIAAEIPSVTPNTA